MGAKGVRLYNPKSPPKVDHILFTLAELNGEKHKQIKLVMEYREKDDPLRFVSFKRDCHVIASAVNGFVSCTTWYSLAAADRRSSEDLTEEEIEQYKAKANELIHLHIKESIADLSLRKDMSHCLPRLWYSKHSMSYMMPEIDDVIMLMGFKPGCTEDDINAYQGKVYNGNGYGSNCHLLAAASYKEVSEECYSEQGFDIEKARKIIASTCIDMLPRGCLCLLNSYYVEMRDIIGMTAPSWGYENERSEVVSQCVCSDCKKEHMDPKWRHYRNEEDPEEAQRRDSQGWDVDFDDPYGDYD